MTQNLPLAVLLTVVASVFLAVAAVVQHYAVGEQSDDEGGGESLGGGQLWALVRSPRWLLGMGLSGVGALIQVAALLMAPVTVVQPLSILAVPWTVMLASRISRHRISGAMWAAVALTVGGTVWFALVAVLFAADHEELDTTRLVSGTLVAFAVAGALALVGSRGRPAWRCFAWSAAGAVVYGLESGMVKAMGEYMATRDWAASATFWFLAVVLVAGALVATVFVQQGYATGPAEIVVGAMNAVNPIAAVAFGIAVLGEGANITRPAALMMAAAAALALFGVALLSRFHPTSPATGDASAPGPDEAGIAPMDQAPGGES